MQVKIEKLVYGGEGLAHHDGATLFVPYVLPGELVEVRPVEQRKKYVRGEATRIASSSPERAAPPCRHFKRCGGCHYQHIPYELQLRYKEEILRETLRRIAGLDWTGPVEIHRSPKLGFRNRAQWKIRPHGERRSSLPGTETHLRIGYFQARSAALIPVEECPILSPRLQETLASLRGAIEGGALPSTIREVEAFVDADDDRQTITASFEGYPKSAPKLAQDFRALLPTLESLLLRDTLDERVELFGPGFLTYRACGREFRVGHMSFFQVNRHLLEEMARAVASAAGNGRLAFDLFAGVGLFSALLAEQFEQTIAVEADPASARDLDVNLVNLFQSRVQAEARNSAAEEFLEEWNRQGGTMRPDMVLLDPPRAGGAPRALAALQNLAPETILYVSCDPATLARDLRGLRGSGYSLEEIHLFDMFPQTFHIESLSKLVRSR